MGKSPEQFAAIKLDVTVPGEHESRQVTDSIPGNPPRKRRTDRAGGTKSAPPASLDHCTRQTRSTPSNGVPSANLPVTVAVV